METTLDVRGVTRRYGTREVLKGITFAAQKGEIIALLGRNGTGKSTLMNTITGYLCQSGGDISICGYDVLIQPLEARRRAVSAGAAAAVSRHDGDGVSALLLPSARAESKYTDGGNRPRD